MNTKPKSTSALLVGFLLIFFLSGPVLSEPPSIVTEQLDACKGISSDLCQPQKSSDLGQLKIGEDTIVFPWGMRHIQGIYSPESVSISRPLSTKDDIIIDGSNSTATVGDLSAINSAKVRDLHYDDSQNGDPKYPGEVNAIGIKVSGKGIGAEDRRSVMGSNNLEKLADKASRLGVMQRNVTGNVTAADPKFGSEKRDLSGNYMGIDIRDISVRAINTMEGGSAVATSNIIINPVQIIDLSPEVEEKLR
jgi:hypothetical protein